MDTYEYQKAAERTLIDGSDVILADHEKMILWAAIGLAGETGEVCEAIKKGILHQHGLDLSKVFKELGDVCWYLAALCTKCGFDLGDVMEMNIEKLMIRYPDGFTSQDSISRVDTK